MLKVFHIHSLRCCLQEQGIRTVFKSETPLWKHLVRNKDSVPQGKQDGIVLILTPCTSDCDNVYIGETGTTVQDRI